LRLIKTQPVKTGLIRPQRIGQDKGIAPVIFGSSPSVTIPETGELLRINRKDVKPALDEPFHDSPAWDLNRYRNTLGLPLAQRPQPSSQLCQAGPIMVDHALSNDLTVTVEHTHPVVLRAPIDPHKPGVSDDLIIGLRWLEGRNNKAH
jgi:hypothetical protein